MVEWPSVFNAMTQVVLQMTCYLMSPKDGLDLKNAEGVNSDYPQIPPCDPHHCKSYGIHVRYVGGGGVIYMEEQKIVKVDGP